jgi:hypothetical protein
VTGFVSLLDLTFPSAGAFELALNLLERDRVLGAKQLSGLSADGFASRPPIKTLRADVPVGDHAAVERPREHGVKGEIDKFVPLAAFNRWRRFRNYVRQTLSRYYRALRRVDRTGRL